VNSSSSTRSEKEPTYPEKNGDGYDLIERLPSKALPADCGNSKDCDSKPDQRLSLGRQNANLLEISQRHQVSAVANREAQHTFAEFAPHDSSVVPHSRGMNETLGVSDARNDQHSDDPGE
jgi:hypothetical protein